MNFWIDAQLPPKLAAWLTETFGVNAMSLKDLGLRNAEDREIFKAAKKPNHIIITKDSDFIDLVNKFGSPPQILWITCGNVTNRNLKVIFTKTFTQALQLLKAGEMMVEISDK